MQQYKLFPLIARAYAFRFVGSKTQHLYDQIDKQILDKGNTEMLPEVLTRSTYDN